MGYSEKIWFHRRRSSSPLHIPPIANPRFTGILQPALGPETSCCVIYDLFSAGNVSLANLANIILRLLASR